MTQVVPLSALPSQTLVVLLGAATYTLNIYQKSFYSDNNESSTMTPITPVFLDIYLNGVAVLSGALCLNNVKLIRNLYLDFLGDLVFTDTQGSTDPLYTGFGTRYVLTYLSPSDLVALGSTNT